MQVLSSLSSIPFYAPSAGYAPTNSADVSAIASAYADSAASGKLDSSASSTFYPSDNPSGFISNAGLSNYATTAYVDSAISGFAYESAVSGWTAKQDALTFGYDTSDKINTINGSALAGEGGGGGGVVTSLQYYTSGSTSTASGTANGFAYAGNSTGSINYYTLDFGEHDPSCITSVKYSQILITADKNADFMTALPLVSSDLSAFTVYKSVADTAEFSSVPDSAKSYVGKLSTITSDLGTAVRYNLTGNNFSSIKTGEENVLVFAYRYMFDHWGTLPVTGTTGSFGFTYGSSSGYSAVSGINELGIYLDTANCYPTSNPSGFISNADLSNYATTAYVDSSVSGKLDATASSQFLTSTAGLVGTGDLTAYAFESSNSAKLDTTAFSDVSGNFLTAVPAGYATTADISGFAYESAVSGWTAKQDSLTFGYDGSNNISSIDGSAIGGQGGGGGIDSATCSAIASAYAESAVSSVSGNYYPATSNPSGYLTSQAQASWSESASASPSYIVDKPDLVDIVAGPGIVVDNPDGNTLRVSTDENYEVELYSNANGDGASTGISLSENPFNFEKIIIRFSASNGLVTKDETIPLSPHAPTRIMISSCTINDAGNRCYLVMGRYSISSTTLTRVNECQSIIEQQSIWTDFNQNMILIYKVIGVHRIANN